MIAPTSLPCENYEIVFSGEEGSSRTEQQLLITFAVSDVPALASNPVDPQEARLENGGLLVGFAPDLAVSFPGLPVLAQEEMVARGEIWVCGLDDSGGIRAAALLALGGLMEAASGALRLNEANSA